VPDTTCHMSISLDGFVAGPGQSREHPLGKRGPELHRWHLGERLFDGAEAFGFEPAEVLHSPLATHVRYRRAG
jgi:hypothetical protein